MLYHTNGVKLIASKNRTLHDDGNNGSPQVLNGFMYNGANWSTGWIAAVLTVPEPERHHHLHQDLTLTL